MNCTLAITACGGLKKMVPNTVTLLGLVGVGVVLLEEVCHCGSWLSGLIYAQAMPSETVHFLFPEQDVELPTASPAPGLPAGHHVPLW